MENEPLIRLAVFLAVFAFMASWEHLRPRRASAASKPRRWLTNWAIVAIDTAVVRLLFPAAAVGAAVDASAQGWGLLNAVGWPAWAEIATAMVVLDFAIWGQHLLMHKIPLLWRLHRVHHADRDVDVSTAIRFHPVEIALSMAIKIGIVYALGAPALAVILFEIVLNGCAMFNHANIGLGRVDRALRWVIVTPDMHRIHHSVRPEETDSNYGFNLPWWDRLFGTYTADPEDGQGAMTLGLARWQDERPTRLGWSLALPFRDPVSVFDDAARAAAAHGLAAAGLTLEEGERPGLRAVILLAADGPRMWAAFSAAPEAADGAPDPLDRWSARVVGALAASLGAEAILPSDGPPFPPFLSWAARGEPVWPSRLGMTLHARRGLWASWRGALGFDRALDLPPPPAPGPRPCDACAAPCLSACPVSAFGADGYDSAGCRAHLSTPQGEECLARGCLARRACPVGAGFAHAPAQAAFHMEAFRAAGRAPG